MSIDELAEAAKLVSDRINEVADAAEDAARFREVRATIYVNAIHGLGCTEEEATAYADGTSEKTFVQALIERFEGVNATAQAKRIADLEGDRDRWKDICQSATGTIGVIRAMIGEMFGATASIESQDATLLRGPEPKHDGEAILEALQRVQSALENDHNALLTPTPQCIHMTAEMAANCPTCNPSALRGLPTMTPQEAAKVLWDMLQLSDGIPKIDQDAAQALWDRVQGAGGFYPVMEFLAELAGIDTGEDSHE